MWRIQGIHGAPLCGAGLDMGPVLQATQQPCGSSSIRAAVLGEHLARAECGNRHTLIWAFYFPVTVQVNRQEWLMESSPTSHSRLGAIR